MPSADRWYGMSTSVTQAYNVANRLMAQGIPVSRGDGYFLVNAEQPGAASALGALVRETGVPVVAMPPFGPLPASYHA